MMKRRTWPIGVLLALACGISVLVLTSGRPDPPIEYHAFGAKVIAQRPSAEPIAFVTLFQTRTSAAQAEELTQRLLGEGIAVARVSLDDPFDAATAGAMSKSEACVDLGKWTHALAKDAEHRLRLASYHVPIVGGMGDGAPLAYLAFHQSAPGTAQALLTIARKDNFDLADQPCTPAAVRLETGYAVKWSMRAGDIWLDLPNADPGPLMTRLGVILRPQTDAAAGKMPISEIPSSSDNPEDALVILYSGDGGWAGLDRTMAAEFSRRGYPVAGISSLEYFWSEHSPDTAAVDLANMIEVYRTKWGRTKVILVGYSFGADVLPFIYDALPQEQKDRVIRLDLLGLGFQADFQFHLSSWLDVTGDAARPTVPLIEQLRGVPIRCIRGERETESACPALKSPAVEKIVLPGDHHFNMDAQRVVDALIARETTSG